MVVRRAHGVDGTAHANDAQDVGQRPEFGKADVLERLPVARDGVGVEEDAAGSDPQRAGRVLSLVLEVEPVLPRTSCSVIGSGGFRKCAASCLTARR